MKRTLVLATAVWFVLHTTRSLAAGVFISEYVEGSSNNKAIELYNSDASPVDLSTFVLRIYFNGSVTPAPGSTLPLSGILAPGDAWVVVHTSADALLLPLGDQAFGGLSFNGNDAIVLEADGVIADSFGQLGFDPGVAWVSGITSTANATLRRMPEVQSGDLNPSDPFDPSLEWLAFDQDTFDGLGVHEAPEPRAGSSMVAAVVALVGARRLRSRAR